MFPVSWHGDGGGAGSGSGSWKTCDLLVDVLRIAQVYILNVSLAEKTPDLLPHRGVIAGEGPPPE